MEDRGGDTVSGANCHPSTGAVFEWFHDEVMARRPQIGDDGWPGQEKQYGISV